MLYEPVQAGDLEHLTVFAVDDTTAAAPALCTA
jgi:hypothetical protein